MNGFRERGNPPGKLASRIDFAAASFLSALWTPSDEGGLIGFLSSGEFSWIKGLRFFLPKSVKSTDSKFRELPSWKAYRGMSPIDSIESRAPKRFLIIRSLLS